VTKRSDPTARRKSAPTSVRFITPDEIDASFDRAFSIVGFILNRHIVDHMLRCARRFDIDFETLVVWGVLAHQNVAHLMPPGSLPSALLDEGGRIPAGEANTLRALRLRDLAQITGIPRETVRRKLLVLRDQGWIIENGEGWILNREAVDPELRAFTLESTRRLIAAAQDVVRMLRDAGELPPD
jgi:hypothetical protein